MNQEHTEKWIIILPLVILTCFSIAYLPAFQTLLKQWSAGDNSYCYLIVPLFVYLLWDMRAKRGIQEAGVGRQETGDRRQNSGDRRQKKNTNIAIQS